MLATAGRAYHGKITLNRGRLVATEGPEHIRAYTPHQKLIVPNKKTE